MRRRVLHLPPTRHCDALRLLKAIFNLVVAYERVPSMPELLAGWENPSQRLVPASRPGRLGFIEGVGFMCYAVRRGEAGAHTWRIHCLARSSARLPDVGFLADGEYSCGSVSGLRGTQSPMHGLKCRDYEAHWASAAHPPRVARSDGSPTLPCAPPILECDRGRSPRHLWEG
jgi:hypothetical protein